jgi:hypothetical protein
MEAAVEKQSTPKVYISEIGTDPVACHYPPASTCCNYTVYLWTVRDETTVKMLRLTSPLGTERTWPIHISHIYAPHLEALSTALMSLSSLQLVACAALPALFVLRCLAKYLNGLRVCYFYFCSGIQAHVCIYAGDQANLGHPLRLWSYLFLWCIAGNTFLESRLGLLLATSE